MGYSYLAPRGKIAGIPSFALGSTYGQINWGACVSITRYFDKHLGAQVEGDEHIQSEDFPLGYNNSTDNSNDDFSGASAGMIYRVPMARFTPFAHALAGAEFSGSVYHPDTWGMVLTAGGGADYNTPLLKHRLAIRIIQADYQFIQATSSGVNAFRLSSGLVYHIGSTGPPWR